MIQPNKLMRSAILSLTVVFATPFAGAVIPLIGTSAAQAATVSRISVSGNRQVDTQTILSILTIRAGENADAAGISNSIAALYKTGFFRNVSVTQSGGVLLVNVSENPIVASVLFQGNQRFSDAELLTMVQASSRSAYSPDRVQADAASIKAAYSSAGYSSATVTPQTASVDGGRTRVTFVINEGSRTGIAAINFTGNNSINTGVLKSVIRTKETGWLSWLLKDDTYDESQLEVDKQLIRNYYANHGYPDAQVNSSVAEFDAKRNGYFITYSINEGDRYSFGPMAVETSIPNLKTDELRNSISTSEGGSYSQADLQKTASDMAFAATSQGYPFADVRPRVDRDVANHRFNITYLVDNGPRVYVERINITGNLKTRDFVIRRELDFSEGDPFNSTLLARDKQAIQGLGFFKSVDISTEPGSAPDRVVIDVAVVEQSTGDYGVTAGYSTEDGILGEVSVTERNFLGRGQYVRAAIGASGSGKTFDFSFTEPRFMGLKVSSGFDVYHHIANQTDNTLYGVTTTGGQVRLGLPITDALSGNVFLGGEHKSFTADPDNSVVVDDGTETNKIFTGYNLNYSTLDDTKHPTTGLYAIFSQQYDGLDFNYVKTEGKARYFVPVGETGIVASVKAQAGIINNLGDGAVDATESFKEGQSLVRGFESGGFGPRANDGEFLGETQYAGVSGELQFPIPFLPESYGLDGAVWADAAYVDGVPSYKGSGSTTPDGSLDPKSVDNKFKSSAGASVIWDSPFGPLRGDFGYVLSKATNDREQVFQITLQTLL